MLYIATLEDIKSALGITDTVDDYILTAVMEGLQTRFDSHLKRLLIRAENVVELFDGDVTFLRPKHWPLESVASVQVSAEQDWSVDPDEEWVAHLERGKIYRNTTKTKWPDGVQNIRVVYTGGYAAGNIPQDICRAFATQMSFEWRNRKNLGNTSISAQGVNVNMAPAKFLPEVEACLLPYMDL
jgi:hypothetical protein